jgi:hypothetical protein
LGGTESTSTDRFKNTHAFIRAHKYLNPMNKRFLISIVACLVATMASNLSAQLPNPLRFKAQPTHQNSSQHYATEESSAIAQQQPVNTQQQASAQQLSNSHQARTVQLQNVPQPQGAASGQTSVQNDFQMPDSVFQAAFDQPIQQSQPSADVVTESIRKPTNNLASLARMINSFPDPKDARGENLNQPTANRSQQPAYSGQLDIRPDIPAINSPTRIDQETASEGDPETPLTEKKFDTQKLMTLIQRLAINTGIVMCVGVGIIFVAKLYFKTKGTHSGGGRSIPKAEIEIKSTLRLSPKSNLHLVEAGDHRLIVAIDQNGIKSVVPLTDSFANSLDGLEDLNGFSELLNSGAAPIQAASPPTPAVAANQAGAYSLATVAQTQPTLPATEQRSLRQRRDEMRAARQAHKSTPELKQQEEDAIRKKMEEAILDQGLKDVILNTLANRKVSA